MLYDMRSGGCLSVEDDNKVLWRRKVPNLHWGDCGILDFISRIADFFRVALKISHLISIARLREQR